MKRNYAKEMLLLRDKARRLLRKLRTLDLATFALREKLRKKTKQ